MRGDQPGWAFRSGQVQVRLLDFDTGLGHRSTQGIVQDRDLGTGQLYAAADQQEREQEEDEQSHQAQA
jgi:hypothetical protein